MTTQSDYHRNPFLVFTKEVVGECQYPGCHWFVKLSPDPQCDSIPYIVEGLEDFTKQLREHQTLAHGPVSKSYQVEVSLSPEQVDILLAQVKALKTPKDK